MAEVNRVGRSPSYPAFDLKEAVSKLEKYEKECRSNAVSTLSAYKAVGYTSANGAAKRALAALRAYGLIEPIGTDGAKVKLSSIGHTIINHRPDSEKRVKAIQEAAMKPKIFRDLLDQYGNELPGDGVLYDYLVEREYNREAIQPVIATFRSSIAFAKLDVEGKVDDEDNPEDDAEGGNAGASGGQGGHTGGQGGGVTGAVTSLTVPVGMKAIPVPLGPDKQMVVHYPANLTKEDLAFFNQIWGLYETRIIVEPPKPPAPPKVITGPALWRTGDADLPVVVTGYYGEKSGRHFATIEGTTTGAPLDELVYGEDE